MKISWRDQLKFNPSLKDMDNWPDIDLEMIPKKKERGLFEIEILLLMY